MMSNRIVPGLCAGLLCLVGCAHHEPRERASVSAVTNRELSDHGGEQGKTRMHYTEVDEDEALGRNKRDVNDQVASGADRVPGGEIARSGQASDDDACELAVFFDQGSSALDRPSTERLDRVAECMKRREIDHALIVGQTDPSGEAKNNRELGLERARVVAEYLRGRGVPEEQIRVRSKGEMASASSEELWPVERRTQIDIRP